jgi:hypothetical protein
MLEMDKAHVERQSQSIGFIYDFVLCPLGFYPIVNSRLPRSFPHHFVFHITLHVENIGVALNDALPSPEGTHLRVHLCRVAELGLGRALPISSIIKG